MGGRRNLNLEAVAIRDSSQMVGMVVGKGHVMVGWSHVMLWEGIHRRHFVLLLPFHPTILKNSILLIQMRIQVLE